MIYHQKDKGLALPMLVAKVDAGTFKNSTEVEDDFLEGYFPSETGCFRCCQLKMTRGNPQFRPSTEVL